MYLVFSVKFRFQRISHKKKKKRKKKEKKKKCQIQIRGDSPTNVFLIVYKWLEDTT